MSFSVVENPVRTIWVPVEPSETLYMGAIASIDIATPLEGVQPMPVAADAGNTTNKDIPLGVVVGMNSTAANRLYSTTYNSEYITQVAAGAVYGSSVNYVGVEGEWARGDRQAFVQIAVIGPNTVLRGSIFNGAYGTAPTEVTVSTGSGGDGIGCTTSAADVATVANFATIYARTGGNRGIYRTLTSASDTTHTWVKAMPTDMAVGDKAVVINGLRPYGPARMQIDSEATYIDCSEALTTNYFDIVVLRLDLAESGKETVDFMFGGDNFCAKRA